MCPCVIHPGVLRCIMRRSIPICEAPLPVSCRRASRFGVPRCQCPAEGHPDLGCPVASVLQRGTEIWDAPSLRRALLCPAEGHPSLACPFACVLQKGTPIWGAPLLRRASLRPAEGHPASRLRLAAQVVTCGCAGSSCTSAARLLQPLL